MMLPSRAGPPIASAALAVAKPGRHGRAMLTLHGIPNCDTVKKARGWLAQHGVEHAFHDYKKQGVPEQRLRGWVDRLGWEALLNRRGTSFRQLPEEVRRDLDADRAVAIMLAHPSTIRRPIAERDGWLAVGFSPDEWAASIG